MFSFIIQFVTTVNFLDSISRVTRSTTNLRWYRTRFIVSPQNINSQQFYILPWKRYIKSNIDTTNSLSTNGYPIKKSHKPASTLLILFLVCLFLISGTDIVLTLIQEKPKGTIFIKKYALIEIIATNQLYIKFSRCTRYFYNIFYNFILGLFIPNWYDILKWEYDLVIIFNMHQWRKGSAGDL